MLSLNLNLGLTLLLCVSLDYYAVLFCNKTGHSHISLLHVFYEEKKKFGKLKSIGYD